MPSSSPPPPIANGDPPSSNAPEPTHVLLVLDAQVNMLAAKGGVPSAATVAPNILAVLAHARSAPAPPRIVHIRNVGDAGEPDEPGTPGFELAYAPAPGEPVLDKRKNNAFAGTRLGELVPPAAQLAIVGMQSDFCVRATCSAALHRGNEVVLVRGAHATFDRDEVLTGGQATPAAQVESEIEGELEEAGVVLLEMKDVPGLWSGQ